VRYATLETVLDEQLKEIVMGELHVARNLLRFGEGVASSELKSQIRQAHDEYQGRSERLERVMKARGVAFQGVHPRVVDAFIKQGVDVVEHRGDDLLLDHGLISILRHLETYQRSLYESAREVANALDEEDVVAIVVRELEEHGRLERSLTVLEEDMLDAIVARRISASKPRSAGEEATR